MGVCVVFVVSIGLLEYFHQTEKSQKKHLYGEVAGKVHLAEIRCNTTSLDTLFLLSQYLHILYKVIFVAFINSKCGEKNDFQFQFQIQNRNSKMNQQYSTLTCFFWAP